MPSTKNTQQVESPTRSETEQQAAPPAQPEKEQQAEQTKKPFNVHEYMKVAGPELIDNMKRRIMQSLLEREAMYRELAEKRQQDKKQ